MNEIIKHPEFGEIRTRIIKGEPWFVGQDVCKILGLHGKGSDNFRPLDDDEKGVQKISTPGGAQELLVVNESGLYNLIFRSNKPAAKAFRKWVTSEVLPLIRRHRSYCIADLRYTTLPVTIFFSSIAKEYAREPLSGSRPEREQGRNPKTRQ